MQSGSTSTSEDTNVRRILLVTTDADALSEFRQVLPPSLETVLVGDVKGMSKALAQKRIDAAILDLDVIGETINDACTALHELRSSANDLVIVALTRSRARTIRLKAEEAGADEFFLAPIEAQELRIVLERAISKREIEIEDRALREQVAGKYIFGELIGGCEAMQRVYDAIGRVAKSNTTVMIRGESGTGKELAARAVVAASGRKDGPFISLNCAALPEGLIETELFGHEKGAFTGADTARAGHIEMADKGTLFLDEIGSLGLPLQSKLLRVLQDHMVTRVGGKTLRKIDFRLIAATNDDLEEMVKTGRFREDLYYRIHVVPIQMPPLRDREGDIALLADHFLRVYCAANQTELKRLEPEVLEILEEHSWPGNIRELENLIQRIVLMADGNVISAKHLPNQILYSSTAKQESLLIPDGGIELDEEMAKIESAFLQAALRRCGGKKVAAAALLHIDPQKMKYLCRKHKIQKD
jgi:DNA-binding NtrC family response regulator